jgi:hypothetical protein
VEILAAAWVAAGTRAPAAASVQSPDLCAFPDCPGRAIVEIRTSLGKYGICFPHFEAVRGVIQAQRHGQPL